MPIYEYYCSSCQHRYEAMRPMPRRDDPAPCPKCGKPGQRQLSLFGFKYEGHYRMGNPRARRPTDPHD